VFVNLKPLVFLLSLAAVSHGGVVFSEGFANVPGLTGAGWAIVNNSNPVGLNNWFQGNDAVFPAQSGAPTAYAGVNYNSTSGGGNISDWLITPQLAVNDGYSISFFTRTVTIPAFPDRLEVRFSSNGASTNVGATDASVGDFTMLLLTVNPTLTTSGYPNGWTQFTSTLSGLGGPASGRFAFRYAVPNGGPSGTNSDYIGVDTLEVSDAGQTTVPEPGSMLLMALPLAALALRRLRSSVH
jgi:hypothetical protein